MFERFTERARQVVVLAQEEARALKHNYIGTEHLLLGLLREEEGVAARVLDSLQISTEEVRAAVVRIVGTGEEVATGQIPFTPRAKKVLELALREALSLGHNYIGTEHILLGLIREDEGVAARILLDLDAEPEKIRNEVMRTLSGPTRRGQTGGPESKKNPKMLDQFGRDLTKLAEEGKLDPVIGRTTEIERVMQMLCRRTKNNPVLIGEPGVGKTADRRGPRPEASPADEVPEPLQGQAVYTSTWRPWWPVPSIAASSKSASRASSKRSREPKRHHPVHRRAAQRGRRRRRRRRHRRLHPQARARARRAAVPSAPPPSTNTASTSSTTPPSNAASSRSRCDEPDDRETDRDPQGLRDKYEAHHQAQVSPTRRCRGGAAWSDRYITDRFLPDKAIDLLDEAASTLRIAPP